MKALFDKVSAASSKLTTRTYSTSFSLGIYSLHKTLHAPIYSIYGFVRFADEIVDSFHTYDKTLLLAEFKEETYKAIDRGISLNPILNSFQQVVHTYNIERDLIDTFLQSMEMDLQNRDYTERSYKQYILGSAEVVGLMCLRVFVQGNDALYQQLKPAAMKLGAAFQKVNFLRDIKNDYEMLGRIYFPGVDMRGFSAKAKKEIEQDIEADFAEAMEGIKRLPSSSRFGVYVACVYYKSLFNKIKTIAPQKMLSQRIRISNTKKMRLLVASYFRHNLRLI